MKLLSKFFLAVLLLTVVSVSWAACPEGYRNNFKGECAPVAKGTTDADTSDREDYDFECAEKTLGRQIIDQFSQGRPPSQDELQKIEHCRVGNRSTQSDGGKQQAKPPQSGERLNESNYNPGCVDATLIDAVTGYCGVYEPDPSKRRGNVTVSLNINFVGHPKGQKLRAVAELDRAGRRLYFASARVTDDCETLVATAEAVYAYVERQPQVQTASS